MNKAKQIKIKGPSRYLYMALGWCCFALAVIGAILPLMPSFVFVLLAAICFSRSSEHCHNWLRQNRYFGQALCDYQAGMGISKANKCRAVAMLWLSIGISVCLVLDKAWLVALLLAIATAVTYYLLSLPTRSLNLTRNSR